MKRTLAHAWKLSQKFNLVSTDMRQLTKLSVPNQASLRSQHFCQSLHYYLDLSSVDPGGIAAGVELNEEILAGDADVAFTRTCWSVKSSGSTHSRGEGCAEWSLLVSRE